jgi:3-deoxy-manno-octulosonate cytidylyltransferase (CMP-KDO synthetase)
VSQVTAIIPALIQHVWEQVRRSKLIDRVIIATDDRRIIDAVRGFGGEAVMTRADHPNGSSRLAEVAAGLSDDIIVNVQADEPDLEAALIDLAIRALGKDPEAPVATLASPFSAGEDPADPNIVKVVVDRRSRAMYFSRALIPFDREGSRTSRPLKHVGLYVYRREFLLKYAALPPSPLELAEHLEQLRMLEHGFAIVVAIGEAHFHGIDTPEQYEAFVQRQRQRSGQGATM